MDAQVMGRAERALLNELDSRLQMEWHETLSDVITDLRIRWVDVKPEAEPDELISVIHSYRLLDFVSTQPLIEIRETIRRIKQGTFGYCSGCGIEISSEILESQPSVKLCPACAHRLNEGRTRDQSGYCSQTSVP